MAKISIVEVTKYHHYRPASFNPMKKDPKCPNCGGSLGHSIVVTGKDTHGKEHELHVKCLK